MPALAEGAVSDDKRSVPLFLCCAEDNEVALVRVVEALQNEGYNPEVVSGVDGDGSLLGNAVDQAEARSLFVLCRSNALDRSHVRRLEGLFSARRGPQQRSVTVTLIQERPLEILPAVREAMKILLESPREPMRPSSELNRDLMRDVIGPDAHDGRDGRADEEREALARKLHQEMVAAEALLTRRDTPSPDEPGTPTPADVERASRNTREIPMAADELGDGVPQAMLPEEETSAFGIDGPATHDEETAPLLNDGSRSALPYVPEKLCESSDEHPIVRDDDGHDRADEAAESVPDGKAAAADDSFDEDTNEQEVGSTTGRHSTPVAAEPADDRPNSRGMVYAGIAGLAAVAVMAVSFMGAEESSDAEIEAAVHRAQSKRDEPTKGVPPKPDPAPVTPAATASPPPVEPTPATPGSDMPPTPGIPPAAPTSPSEPEPPKEPEPSPEPIAEPPPVEPPTPEPPAEPPPKPTAPSTPPAPPSPTVDPDAKRISAAIAAGRLEDLGGKVASLGDGESMTWSQANRACRKRNVDGIGKFRLPNQRELARMKRSGVLAKGAYYWARDKAESEDEAFALDTGSGDVNIYLKMESIARAACVRRK